MKKLVLLLCLSGTAFAAQPISLSTALKKAMSVERTPDFIRFFVTYPDTGEEVKIVLDGDGLSGKAAQHYNLTYDGFSYDAAVYSAGYLMGFVIGCNRLNVPEAAFNFVNDSIVRGVRQGKGTFQKVFGRTTVRVEALGRYNGSFRYTVFMTIPKTAARCTF